MIFFSCVNPSFLYGLSPQQLSAATLSAFGRFLCVSFSCFSLSVFFKSSHTLPLEFFIRVHIVFLSSIIKQTKGYKQEEGHEFRLNTLYIPAWLEPFFRLISKLDS